ncbi:MAG: hypothetical protein ACREPH_07800, partial [Rhodanobacteraceae bacterium]
GGLGGIGGNAGHAGLFFLVWDVTSPNWGRMRRSKGVVPWICRTDYDNPSDFRVMIGLFILRMMRTR